MYRDEAAPPPSLLQAALASGRDGFQRCVVFHSPVEALERARACARASSPAIRRCIKPFLLYRTYHGCAMPVPTQLASDRGLERRRARRGEPRAVSREVRARAADARAACWTWSSPDGALLPVAGRAAATTKRFTRELFARAESHGAAGQLPGARHARPATRAGGACASRSSRRVDECVDGRAAHPQFPGEVTRVTDIDRALAATIDAAFERRAEITAKTAPPRAAPAHRGDASSCSTRGQARVAEKHDGEWVVNQWLKKAVLLYFRTHDNTLIDAGYTRFFDKVPLKYAARSHGRRQLLTTGGTRVVPPAIARRGAYIAPNVVLMPSYVNIGAYVDSGTMVDTWATVGSCAQIGKNVHLSGGVGIGGVLEPLQAEPDDHRGQLLHRRALGGRRRRDRRGRLGDLDGRVHRPEHEDLRPRDRRGACTAACPPARWWCRATCRPPTASTRCTAPSSSSASTRRRAPRPRSTSCCARIERGSRARMTPAEILRRRLENQALARTSFRTPEEVVAWFGAVQAQDYLGSLWALGLRMRSATRSRRGSRRVAARHRPRPGPCAAPCTSWPPPTCAG